MSNLSKSRIRSCQIGSVGGVSSIIVYARELDTHAQGMDLPILHVAVGDLLDLQSRQGFRSPMSIFGRLGVAAELARVDARTGTTRTGDDEVVRLYGELTASWVNLSMTTIEDQQSTFIQVMQRLRGHPPKVNDYIKYAKKCLKAISASTGGSFVTPNKVQDDLGFNVLRYNKYTVQWYEFHMYRGQWVPWKLMTTDNDLLSTLNDLVSEDGSQEYKQTTSNKELEWESAVFKDWWMSKATDDEILAYCEGIAYSELAVTRLQTYAAIFVSIATLIKDTNFTVNWLTTRLERLSKEMGLIDLDAYVTMEIIVASSKIYPRIKLTADQVFSYLTSLYAMIKDSSSAASLNWIIEQAACSQITMALDFASGINRNTFINIDNMLDKFPKQQVSSYGQLCVEMVRDRFCSFITPPVKMADIADLAYLGGSLMGELEKRVGCQGLASAGPKCTKTEFNT